MRPAELSEEVDRALEDEDHGALRSALEGAGKLLNEAPDALNPQEAAALEAASARAAARLRTRRDDVRREIRELRAARERLAAFRPSQQRRPPRVDLEL